MTFYRSTDPWRGRPVPTQGASVRTLAILAGVEANVFYRQGPTEYFIDGRQVTRDALVAYIAGGGRWSHELTKGSDD